MRVLKGSAKLTPVKVNDYSELSLADGAVYEVIMPSDYLQLLNCSCIYNVKRTFKCYNEGDTWRAAATRLTSDMYSQVLDNFWNKPTYFRPYYFIHNVNTSSTAPYNPYKNGHGTDEPRISLAQSEVQDGVLYEGSGNTYGTDLEGNSIGEGIGFPNSINIAGEQMSLR